MAIDALTGRAFDPANGKAPDAAVIVLHGYGASGNDLIGLAPAFAGIIPSAIFYAPNAPQRWEGGAMGAYQWFGLAGYDPVALQHDPAARAARFRALAVGADAAAGVLNKFINQVMTEHKLSANRIALLGFSQGTMMALHVGLRRPAQLAAILGYSGALTGADRLPAEITSKPPVCLVHGADDPVVPPHCLEDIEHALTPLGVPVQTYMLPGLQHGIDNQGARIGANFLKKYIA